MTAALGLTTVLLVGGCGSPPPADPGAAATTPPGSPTSSPTSSPSPAGTPATSSTPVPTAPTCAELAGRLSLDEQVGQLLMVAVSSSGLEPDVATVLRRTKAGSAVLLGNSTRGRSATHRVAADIREAMAGPNGVRGFVAADQEGGLVQRLRGPGFDSITSAEVQARSSNRSLTRAATRWGRQLGAAGIDVNLAPVADVVPAELTSVNEPIGRLHRGYGSNPATVAVKVDAVIAGMAEAGVVTTAKHFPGLGRVRGNTDLSSHVVDPVTTRHDPALAGFRAAVRAGVPMVMMSSAHYQRIDPDHPAAFSSVVVTQMLRGDLGFDGVVVSDDLSATAFRDVAVEQRAVRFVQAGGDLAIVGDPGQAGRMAAALQSRAGQDQAFARRLRESTTRVLVIKAGQQKADCRPAG